MKQTVISKDLANRKLSIVREFNAPVEKVWKAWTESQLLDKWWAPKPWKAETKTMNFTEGGMWLYHMVGPDGTGAWCRVDFKTIDTPNSFSAVSRFCDEDGVVNEDFPSMYWKNVFLADGVQAKVEIEITFDKDSDLETIIQMGFEAGFTAGLSNLDELLAQ